MSFAATLPATALETGDRFEVFLSADARTIGLPESLVDLNLAIEQLLDPRGRPLSFRRDEAQTTLGLHRWTGPASRARSGWSIRAQGGFSYASSRPTPQR